MRQAILSRLRRLPVQWLIHAVARFSRPLTMGVRAVILDSQGRVFLLKHTYVQGWHLPGGGLEPGETAWLAMRRETQEEAGLAIEGEPVLHGVFLNRHRDHVVVYVVRAFSTLADPKPDWEIAERGFFDPAHLPEGTTAATRARLREVIDGAPPAETW